MVCTQAQLEGEHHTEVTSLYLCNVDDISQHGLEIPQGFIWIFCLYEQSKQFDDF